MSTLHDRLAVILPARRKEIHDLVAEHGDVAISQVTVKQLAGGQRGVKSLLCDTSTVDPEKGLFVGGIPISELTDLWPEDIFHLLCTGERPTAKDRASLQADLRPRRKIPDYVWTVLRALPRDAHPMNLLSVGIQALERDSVFREKYREGMAKEDYWEPTLEDSLDLLAKLPALAGGVYRLRFGKGDPLPDRPELDWGASYAHHMGLDMADGRAADLMRLYLTLHADHESGNVSAYASHVVGSALSDAYYSVSAGINGLAGPLHGLANQLALRWLQDLIAASGGGVPTDEEIRAFTEKTLADGKVVPGYGHGVLRNIDPRFTALHQLGAKSCPDDPVWRTMDRAFHVVPGVLQKHPKIANPWPNVDAGSGSILHHFGITELQYYTVIFAVSRSLGLTAQLVWNRGIGTPITRPKSVSTGWLKSELARLAPAGA